MNKGLFSVLYMFAITLVFTSIVSGVRLVNEDKIRTNEKARLQAVVLDVLGTGIHPAAGPEALVGTFQKRVKPVAVGGETVYAAYDQNGAGPVAYAVSVTGPGFWGPVSCMIGFSADFSRITGVNFYRHTETPGLGARISEEWFQDQFAGLSILTPAGGRIFSLTPEGDVKAPGELDAVTGATQTSLAVERLLNREISRLNREVFPSLRERT